MLVDPPSGWKYGFPRSYKPDRDGELGSFLVKHGYPAEDLDFALRHIRCISEGPEWSAKEEDFLKNSP